MLPELKRLIDLQDLDAVIREVQVGLQKLPEEIKAREEAIAARQAAQGALKEELAELKQQRRDTETEVAEMEDGIKKSRQRLMEIKSNIEYKAMIKEIAFKEDQRDQKETRLLNLLEQMETRSRTWTEEEKDLAQEGEALERDRGQTAIELKALKQKLAGLDKQREILLRDLPAGLLKKYEFIRQRRNGSAITEARQGVCQGCYMNILPQQVIDLQKGEEIIQCPHCQRIIYWVVPEEEEAGKPAARRAP